MHTMQKLVIMGVSGCGKSSVANAVASALDWQMLEGDTYHPAANIEKMRCGIALTDEDRADWLTTLGGLLAQPTQGVVLSCSALKKKYRDVLRQHAPDLHFVFLDLPKELALQRVAARGNTHFLPTSIVQSQFEALEPPTNEPGVLHTEAAMPLSNIVNDVVRWTQCA
jgi:gluconokinase